MKGQRDGGICLNQKSIRHSEENYIEKVAQIVERIKYGNVTLIIQDGKVIQIDKTEKIRL